MIRDTFAGHKLEVTILESTVRVPLWSAHTPYALRKTVEGFPNVPGVVFPVGFEYLTIKDK